jgi:hypothetical protein
MNKNLLVWILMALTVTAAAAQAPTKDALIARAKSFELDTPYVPPPGDPLTHHAAGFAARGDVRDHIVLHKNDHRLRIGARGPCGSRSV